MFESLKELGFSDYEAKVIEGIIKSSEPVTAREISELTGVPRTKVYEVLAKLIRKKIVTEIAGKPSKFFIEEPEKKLIKYVEMEAKRKIEEIKKLNLKEKYWVPLSPIKVAFGMKEVFEMVNEFFKEAKEEILLISIGEMVPGKTLKVWMEASKRVKVHKFICSKYDEENKGVIDYYKRELKLEVRHNPELKGFSLIIVDGKMAYLNARSEEYPYIKGSFCVAIFHKPIAQSFRIFFNKVWKDSKPV